MARRDRPTPGRLLHADGRPNTVRINDRRRIEVSYFLISASWPVFLAVIFGVYLATNLAFGLAYLWTDGLENAVPGSFGDAFFFSVQTLATIGYGKLVPVGLAANLLVTLEALLGMLLTALAAGLIFARFTRPTAGALFSNVLVIGRFDGRPAAMFRVLPRRNDQLTDAVMRLVMIRRETTADGEPFRRLIDLPLARSSSPVFGLSWTVVHEIVPGSPFYGETPESLAAGWATVIALLSGYHERYSATVHARRAYTTADFRWDVRFANILEEEPSGRQIIDLGRFHDVVPLEVPHSEIDPTLS